MYRRWICIVSKARACSQTFIIDTMVNRVRKTDVCSRKQTRNQNLYSFGTSKSCRRGWPYFVQDLCPQRGNNICHKKYCAINRIFFALSRRWYFCMGRFLKYNTISSIENRINTLFMTEFKTKHKNISQNLNSSVWTESFSRSSKRKMWKLVIHHAGAIFTMRPKNNAVFYEVRGNLVSLFLHTSLCRGVRVKKIIQNTGWVRINIWSEHIVWKREYATGSLAVNYGIAPIAQRKSSMFFYIYFRIISKCEK